MPTPSAARHTTGTSIGAPALPAALPTYGIRFCAKNPPRLPIELIAAMLAAARAPEKKRGGSDQKHGYSSGMHAPPSTSAAKRRGRPGSARLSAKPATPTPATAATALSTIRSRLSRAGNHSSSSAAIAQGIMFSSPFSDDGTPLLFNSVGSQYVTPYSDVDISMYASANISTRGSTSARHGDSDTASGDASRLSAASATRFSSSDRNVARSTDSGK